jgi:signal transduction histidine kinase/DNA-binding response OmpR family regulator
MTHAAMNAEIPIRVLVAEDDLRAREVLVARLGAAGFHVTPCADGLEAIELARRLKPDAIVSDALMPRVNGFQLCQMVRRDDVVCSTAFILYTATYTEDEDRQLAIRSGADALVVKPDEAASLIDVIVSIVNRVREQPPRAPETAPPTLAFFDEYARRMAAKLEQKIAELRDRNDALQLSEKEVRALNLRLAQIVEHLEREVGERRRTEAVLELAEEVAMVGSWSMDVASGETRCSRAAAAMLGIASAERDSFTIALLLERVVPSQASVLRRLIDEMHDDDRDVDTEVDLMPTAETAARAVHVRYRTFRDTAGLPIRRIGTLHDISSRRQAKEKADALEKRLRQAQKLEALGNLAGGIAHDFNNILTAILAHAEMQQVGLEDATDSNGVLALESAREIQMASFRARDLVSQILTFSRSQRVERSALDPSPIVAEAVRLVKAGAPPNVQFVEHMPSIGARILINGGQWHQVVVNLLMNAVHATQGRGGQVRVRLLTTIVAQAFADVHPPLIAGPAMHLEVTDTGVGMDAATMARVFEPFFTTRSRANGTGLGLAVVHGIIDDCGGAIVVESDPGRGTSFSVYVPLVPDSAIANAQKAARLPSELPAGRGERVLLVDDEPSVTRIGTRMLEHLGYVVESVNDPTDAVELLSLRYQEFDLIITDRSMPRMTGEQLCASVLRFNPSLPIVLMTAFGDGMDQHDVRALGFRALMTKPFTLQTLAGVCARAIAM